MVDRDNEPPPHGDQGGICPKCQGTGEAEGMTCPRCEGTGKLVEGIGQ